MAGFSDIQNEVLAKVRLAGIEFKSFEPNYELKTTLKKTTLYFTLVLSGVKVASFPEIKNALVRVHYELSSPKNIDVSYDIIEAFEFSDTLKPPEIESAKKRFGEWITSFFSDLVKHLYMLIQEEHP
jgi:hypothetical protein